MMNWYIGTIGFSYRDWVGSFYPPGTTQRGYLSYYTKVFNAVELNTTFHAIPRKSTVQSWANTTPSNFRFCLKTPRVITHDLGLANAQNLMSEFLDSISPLGEKCGPILIQLPPKFTQEKYAILEQYLLSLPKTYHYAIEFRHISWYNEKTIHLLSDNQIAWVAIDYPNLPKEIFPITNIIYIRWIGINNLYHHHTHERVDKTESLKRWLELLTQYNTNIDSIYGFFNNDYAGFAAGTALRFKHLAGLKDSKEKVPYQDKFL